MTEEENKAIEYNLKQVRDSYELHGSDWAKNAINEALSLIQSQQEEIEKNKEFINYLQLKDIKNLDIIIYMANFINDNTPYTKDMKILEDEKGMRTVNFTVQYFEKKVEGK